MIAQLVQYAIRPGTEKQALAYIRKMQDHTRREPGCRLYVGQQSLEDPRRFCFYEQYDDTAALEAHRAAPYFREYVTEGLAKLMETVTRELFAPVSPVTSAQG